MSFLDKLSAFMPFSKKAEVLEYFFALDITNENLTASLWTIEGKQLKILEIASEQYSSLSDVTSITDKLLDTVLGIREIEPQKILFGVPSAWLSDENLKDEYLQVVKSLVKELELTPMAYVESSRALAHFLEKQEGIPTTAILVGFEKNNLTVTVVRAGKLDGTKVVSKGDSSGVSIEKALLTFTGVETLPSKILIYGETDGLKDKLLSYPWMSKLSFLHFPKIEVLPKDVEIKSICLAGAIEFKEDVIYTDLVSLDNVESKKSAALDIAKETKPVKETIEKTLTGEDIGFVVGDVESLTTDQVDIVEDNLVEIEDFEQDLAVAAPPEPKLKKKLNLKRFIPGKFTNFTILGGILAVLVILVGSYLFLPKAQVKIFVEPKVLEQDTQVTADPSQKLVDEDAKIIPGQLVDTQVSGSAKDSASGKKQIGDPAKGVVKIINNSDKAQSFSKGTTISTSSNIKYTINFSVNVASTSAFADSKSIVTAEVTAVNVGADGNLPSGTQFNSSITDVAIVAQGNFSGGTSKEVTVVSEADQKRLLATLTSDLKKQAQGQLQEKLPQKKILTEALAEEITKKSFNKNINDQASEFSLNLTVKYKGTAFEDQDLKQIVSKLVTTQVPEGFLLNLQETETQADVSKLEKDGKLIFLARFKAKLMPKIDAEIVKDKIKGKSLNEALNIIKSIENVLGSEIKIFPSLPNFLQRLPFLGKNIVIDVGLK